VGHRARPALIEAYLARPHAARVAAFVLLVAVGVAALVVPDGPLRIDSAWSEWMHDLRTSALDQLALVFNSLGRGFARALTLVLIGVVLIWRRRWRALLSFALVEAIAPTLSTILKAVVDRERPPDARLHAAGASFPSGHTVYAAATCITVVALFVASGRGRRAGWVAAAVLTAVMAWSRTYLQVHWLSDVVAGAALGAGVALAVLAGLRSAGAEAVRGHLPSRVDGESHALPVPRQHG
jgi:undecaprenyl-diphosphatase